MSVTVVDPGRQEEIRSIVRLLDGVLDAVVNTYAQAGVSLPERRYWTIEQPSVDCEQLVVSFVQAYIGPPGDEANTPQNCNAVKTAVLNVQVSRCIPVSNAKGRAPSGSAITAGAEPLMIDAYLLLDSASQLEQWDLNGPGLGIISTIEVAPPQGGFQGVTLQLTTAIP